MLVLLPILKIGLGFTKATLKPKRIDVVSQIIVMKSVYPLLISMVSFKSRLLNILATPPSTTILMTFSGQEKNIGKVNFSP